MVDPSVLASLKAWFDSHVRAFLGTDARRDPAIRLKRDHTARVCAEALDVAESLDLPDDEMRLVEAAALFHDLGRFEQFARYGTFMDSRSENHALLGVRVLARTRVIDELDPTTRGLIIRSVAYHNRLSIPERETEPCRRLARIVRDADKLDIWRTAIAYFRNEPGDYADAITLDLPDRPEISPEILEAVMGGRLPRMDRMRTLSDFKATQMGWVFDLNFRRSFERVVERRFLEGLRDTMVPSDARDRVFTRTRAQAESRARG